MINIKFKKWYICFFELEPSINTIIKHIINTKYKYYKLQIENTWECLQCWKGGCDDFEWEDGMVLKIICGP